MAANTTPSRRKKADLYGAEDDLALGPCDRRRPLLSGSYRLFTAASEKSSPRCVTRNRPLGGVLVASTAY